MHTWTAETSTRNWKTQSWCLTALSWIYTQGFEAPWTILDQSSWPDQFLVPGYFKMFQDQRSENSSCPIQNSQLAEVALWCRPPPQRWHMRLPSLFFRSVIAQAPGSHFKESMFRAFIVSQTASHLTFSKIITTTQLLWFCRFWSTEAPQEEQALEIEAVHRLRDQTWWGKVNKDEHLGFIWFNYVQLV